MRPLKHSSDPTKTLVTDLSLTSGGNDFEMKQKNRIEPNETKTARK